MEEQVINEPAAEPKSTFRYFPFFNQKQPVFVLVLIGIIFYCTSLYNEYALDDGIVIHQNSYVLKGVAGIKDIMGRDLYASFYERMNATDQLQGGRYHPVSVVTFALEQELMGAYRSGLYQQVADLNLNGVLDPEKVNYTSPGGRPDINYEYNEFVDLNGDKIAQPDECNNCWDTNKDFHNQPSEDLNKDGVFNEVDCQVYRADVRHFNNIWFYVLASVLLYLVFSRHIFKENQDMAFLAALIFLIHPVHSEVVANIRGRAEILCVLFIALTFLYSFKFIETRKTGALLVASLLFLLALLSMEYSIMLLILVPLAMYVFKEQKINFSFLIILTFIFLVVFALMILLKLKLGSILPGALLIPSGMVLFAGILLIAFRKALFINKDLNTLMAGFFTFCLLYVGLRLNAVNIMPGIPDTEILNNPYLLATGEEKFASKIFVLLKYLVLSIFPASLNSDYSYDTLVYRNFLDPGFIISLLVNLGLLITGVLLSIRRHVLGFAIITYYAFLLLVSNFIFAVGLTMREGFLFHASIGVAIAFSWLIINGLEKLTAISFSVKRSSLLLGVLIILFLCGAKTWERNWDWKNDVTLFLKDVKSNPNSVLILGNAGARWIDLADTREITGITMPGEDSTRFNDYNGTLKITDEEMKNGGFATKREAALQRGIDYLKHAVDLHPRYVNGFLNLGLASYKLGDDFSTIYYWKLAENLYPNNPYLRNYYMVYTNLLKSRGLEAFNTGRLQDAAMAYKMWTIVQPNEAEAWYNLGGPYFNQHKFEEARKCWERALEINPGYEEVKKAMKVLPKENRLIVR